MKRLVLKVVMMRMTKVRSTKKKTASIKMDFAWVFIIFCVVWIGSKLSCNES